MHWSTLVLAFTAASGVYASPPNYNFRGGPTKYQGSQVIRVDLGTRKDVSRVKNIVEGLKLDVWENRYRPGGMVDVVVPKQHLPSFRAHLDGMNTRTMHSDLAHSIARESPRKFGFVHAAMAGGNSSSWFEGYHPYQEHLDWMTQLNKAHPDNSEIVTAGKSSEGKDITGIHIWGKEKGSKPAAIFHGTVHAREWITTMVVESFADRLLSDEGSKYTENFDFHIFPIMNPDGFVYTQEKDRMWRKNRQDAKDGGDCGGTDINRNWDSHWDQEGGASTDSCAEDYKGTAALSTPEAKGMTDYIQALAKSSAGARIYIDFHSYSQLLMSPWGWTCDEKPKDDADLEKVLSGWNDAMKAVHGTEFKYGPTCTTIYQTSGDSVDWTYGSLNIKYSFAVELRDTGDNGFVLPPEEIKPSCEESWAGMQYFLDTVAKDSGSK